MAERSDKGDTLALVVLSGAFERVHYALATAAAAAALDRPVLLFFTQGAVTALLTGTDEAPGWHRLAVEPGLAGGNAASRDRAFRERGAAGFEDLLAACKELGIRFLVCSMGLRVAGAKRAALRADLEIEETGLTDLLARAGALVFI
jgi:peroxiredoxin family protein